MFISYYTPALLIYDSDSLSMSFHISLNNHQNYHGFKNNELCNRSVAGIIEHVFRSFLSFRFGTGILVIQDSQSANTNSFGDSSSGMFSTFSLVELFVCVCVCGGGCTCMCVHNMCV